MWAKTIFSASLVPAEVGDDLGEGLERVLGRVAARDDASAPGRSGRAKGGAGERLLARLARGLVADDGVEVLGARQRSVAAPPPRRGRAARRRARLAPRTGGAERRAEPAGPLGGAEDVLLGVGAVRHLGGDVEPLGEQRRHRLVVLDQVGSSGPPAAIAQRVRVSSREPREPLIRACGSR